MSRGELQEKWSPALQEILGTVKIAVVHLTQFFVRVLRRSYVNKRLHSDGSRHVNTSLIRQWKKMASTKSKAKQCWHHPLITGQLFKNVEKCKGSTISANLSPPHICAVVIWTVDKSQVCCLSIHAGPAQLFQQIMEAIVLRGFILGLVFHCTSPFKDLN